MKKQDIRLYNVLFPIWFFYFFPIVWLLILPVNFLVDSLVLCLSARHQGIGDRLPFWKKHILPVWGIGFLSDLVGAGLIFLLYMLLTQIPAVPTLLLFPGTTLLSLPGVALAGVLIYWLNRKLTFRKASLDPTVVHRLCLHLAIFTAPYTMLIPLYG